MTNAETKFGMLPHRVRTVMAIHFSVCMLVFVLLSPPFVRRGERLSLCRCIVIALVLTGWLYTTKHCDDVHPVMIVFRGLHTAMNSLRA
jgi:hypothetical protein